MINFFFQKKTSYKLNGRPLNDMNVCLGRVHAASYNTNRIGGVMGRVLASTGVECGRSWVRAPVGSYQRLYKLIFLFLW
jgi:hypothetical protein